MKLNALPRLMEIHHSGKMVMNYYHSIPKFHTDRLTGSATACLGFIPENDYYVPNTAIQKDIRAITLDNSQRVLARLR